MTSRNKSLWEQKPELPKNYFVSGKAYTDPNIYDKEKEEIFSQTWQFACHESEVLNTFDFRVFECAGKSIFSIKGEDGVVRSFLNVCSHRGAKLFSQPSGNAKVIKCFYHHWTYNTNGECTGIPRPIAYPKKNINKSAMGLREIHTKVYLGMVFINLSNTPPSLIGYIGAALDNFRDMLGTKPLEVFHYNKVLVNSNWKAWQETNMDIYHELMHVVLRKTQMKAMPMKDRKLSIFNGGHGGSGSSLKASYTGYKGLADRKEEVCPLPGMTPSDFKFMNLFPNFTIIARGTAIRIDKITPLSPSTAALEMWGLGLLGESVDDRKIRQRHHNQYWGPFGRNVPEDIIAAESCADSFRGEGGQYQIIARDEAGTGQDDMILRAFYAEWSRRLKIDPGAL